MSQIQRHKSSFYQENKPEVGGDPPPDMDVLTQPSFRSNAYLIRKVPRFLVWSRVWGTLRRVPFLAIKEEIEYLVKEETSQNGIENDDRPINPAPGKVFPFLFAQDFLGGGVVLLGIAHG